ncbi:MAG: NAD-dependent epimerase/dehydratase family protein [Pseudomonadota bacterium]
MRVLVTGGAGFIGSHVVRAVLAAGHEALVLDDLSGGKRENLPPGVELIVEDVREPGLMKSLAGRGIAAVSHHAAQISVPESVKDPLTDAQVNVVGTLNLLQCASAWGARRFIFISSGGAVYGEPEYVPVREDHPIRPLAPYAVSKLCGENYLDYFARCRDLDTVTLRYSNVYGPRQIPHGEAGVVAIFMDALLEGREPTIYCPEGMPEGCLRDYIYVKDCARANVLALTAGAGAYNLGTGVTTSTLGIWRAIQAAAGQSLGHHLGPFRPGDLLRSALDSRRAGAELGWQPQYDLTRGIAETWAWRTGQSEEA